MIKVLFICHGNICRSPMAEFLMKDLVQKKGISNQFLIASVPPAMKKSAIHPITAPARSFPALAFPAAENRRAG